MAKYIIDETTLQNLANSIRRVNGESKSYTPTEMIEAVTHIMDSATYILVDQYGKEYPAVYVESKTVFDATENDIRIGTTAATDAGITVGKKEIPSYIVSEGAAIIPNGSAFKISFFNEMYDFTKLQAIICTFSGSLNGSVAANKIVINDGVYAVNSSELIANVTKNESDKTVELGIANTSGSICILRFFTYKEVN